MKASIFRKVYPEKWQALRQAVIERANGQCECDMLGAEDGATPCQNPIVDVHHLVYPIDPEKTTIEHLRGLCRTCHETRHEKNSVLDTLPCCRYYHKPFPYRRKRDDIPF